MAVHPHGHHNRYYINGCRCDECRAAATAYSRRRREIRGRVSCPVDNCGIITPPGEPVCSGHARRPEGRIRIPNGSDAAGYDAAHKRILRAKGSARHRWCEHCDSVAHQWAFIHGSPDARPVGVKGNGRPHGPFSLNPDHYMPLCAACHKVYDLAQMKVAA